MLNLLNSFLLRANEMLAQGEPAQAEWLLCNALGLANSVARSRVPHIMRALNAARRVEVQS